jgi:uncharacterized protein (UPF0332 family)
MTEPAQLIAQARNLARQPRQGRPRQVDLRRAVSGSYYALFHTFARLGTDLLVGATERKSDRYLIVYRSYDHGLMLNTCKSAQAGSSSHLQIAASAFIELQAHRHQADYNPQFKFSRSEVVDFINTAEAAIEAVSDASEDDRNLFLTSLLLKGRR